MNKTIVLFVSLILLYGNCFSIDKDSSKNELSKSEYFAEVKKLQNDSKEIYSIFSVFELQIVEEEYQKLNMDLHKVEEALNELGDSEEIKRGNEFFDLYENAMKSYSEFISLYDFYIQMEDKKERWSNQYFRLWEQTYALKSRIEILYVKEEKVNVHYGGMKDAKYISIRKRGIYEACNTIYNYDMLRLKRLNDCNFYDRILLLNDLIPVLRKCEKLVYAKSTRSLEKSLKKTDDPEQMAKFIVNYNIE